jgi:glycosyltransferase involved in cell wall biosynthesis
MAIENFRPDDLPKADRRGNLAVLAPRREQLAIVSTYDKLCGIAAYTRALKRQLGEIFDVTVFDLDQDLLRSPHRRVSRLGDRHIKEICTALTAFDAVNLQLEFGILGTTRGDIRRRLTWLAAAAPRLSVTFHTVKRPTGFPYADFLKKIGTLKFRVAGDILSAFRRNQHLSIGVARMLRQLQRHKPVSVIVHNRRDASDFRHVYGFERVFEHPLAFLSPGEAETAVGEATRRRFPLLDKLPADAVLVGVFGFLNDYKGFGTAIRSLYHLPKTHHLLIFGGIHPNEIAPHQPIHPYLLSLLDDAHVDARLGKAREHRSRRTAGQSAGDPRDLSERVHFMGTPEDVDFLAGMAICDAVVFPYLEVGQSASGPISQALELGRRIIASRTHTFLEFAAYHPDRVEFFDIGNHLELAARILARPQYAARRERPRYSVETNKAVYLAANSAPTAAASQFQRRAKRVAIRKREAG